MEKKGAIPEPLITSTPLCETPYPHPFSSFLLPSPQFLRLGLNRDIEER